MCLRNVYEDRLLRDDLHAESTLDIIVSDVGFTLIC